MRNYEASNRMLFAEYLGRDLPPLFSSRANDLSAPAPNAAPRAKARSAEELAIRALAGIWRGGAGPGHAAGAAEVAAARKAAPAPVPEWRRRPLATVAAPDFAAALAERGIATADCLVFVPPAGAGPASADAVPLEACGPFHALDFPRPTLFAGDVRISPPAAVVLVRDATVTAGRLDAEARTVHGAIYDASGNLLVDATRRGVSPQHAADADRLAQTRMVRARRTGGLAVYLGWLTEGLSGFLLESVARLYVVPALRDMNPCFVMHPLGARVALDSAFDKDFVRESMAAFGIARDDILLVDRDRHFDNLLVPPAQLLRGIGAGPRQREVIERIAAHCLAGVPAAPSRRRIFFSRADSADGSEPVNGKELAAMFASHGFDIVDPDATGFVGQVAQLASADMLAGCSDPSLYMASFLPADASLLCLCPGEITRNQVLIGCVRDTKTRYIRAADGKPAGGGPRGTWRADIPRIEAHLVQMLAAAGAG